MIIGIPALWVSPKRLALRELKVLHASDDVSPYSAVSPKRLALRELKVSIDDEEDLIAILRFTQTTRLERTESCGGLASPPR